MKTHARRNRPRTRAFTLLEVLMVVVIIGLLAAFVVPNLWDVEGKQKVKLAQAAVDTGLSGTLDMYRASMGRFPTTDQGLIALYQPPDDEEDAKKWVQVIKKPEDLKDAWGNDYIYTCPGQYNERSYDLSSPGPDGQEGTEDDVCNWKRT